MSEERCVPAACSSSTRRSPARVDTSSTFRPSSTERATSADGDLPSDRGASSGLDATPQLYLTASRALLIAVGRYLARARPQEVRSGIGELEIQKLVYFLKLLVGAFPLTFTRGRYGSCAEKLAQVLDRPVGG